MNILPTKSWHVRNKDNIARVRKDEENARKEEEERLQRIALAESEHRTSLLRTHAQKRKRDNDEVYEETPVTKAAKPEHLNFFQQFEEGEKVSKTNADYEKEKKDEKEKQEKAIGLLTYLGKSAIESQNETPWYQKPAETSKTAEQMTADEIVKSQKSLRRKAGMDPIHSINNFLIAKKKADESVAASTSTAVKRKHHETKERAAISVLSSNDDNSSSDGNRKKKKRKKQKEKKLKKKSKKHKKSKKSKRHKLSDGSASLVVIKTESKSIEQLRAERLKREQEERRKSQELIARVHGGGGKDTRQQAEKVEYDDRRRSYNSQFNPELARQREKI